MWRFASQAIAGGGLWPKNTQSNPAASTGDCSDDEVSSCTSREEGLECPICWESFNIVENVPYVLWCGHTLCKNCVLALQWAVVKFPSSPIQLPLFISCPWCQLLSFRFVYKGNLKFPHKNYFLLWMIESLNGDRNKSHSSLCRIPYQPVSHANGGTSLAGYHNCNVRRSLQQSQASPEQESALNQYLNAERINASLRKSLVFFGQLTAKTLWVIAFLFIVLCGIPTSATILVLYIFVTIMFALPSFLMLYFAYPSLDWLIRKIIS